MRRQSIRMVLSSPQMSAEPLLRAGPNNQSEKRLRTFVQDQHRQSIERGVVAYK